MNFDDQDWEAEEQSSLDRRDRTTAWKVAAGVAVGIVLGGTLMYAVDHYAVWRGMAQGGPVFKSAVRAPGPVADAGPKAPPRPLPDTVAAGPSLDQQVPPAAAGPQLRAEAGKAAAPGHAEFEARAARRAGSRAVELKERAWAMFYTKPAQCDDNPTKATMVECANHFIRAKRRFEEIYGADKPRPITAPASSNGSAPGH